MGQVEIRMICEQLRAMVEDPDDDDDDSSSSKKIFRRKPCMTWDNYFSGDKLMDWSGENGFGAVMTCQQDRLPQSAKKDSFHHKKTNTDLRTKVCRFLEPVVG